MPGEPWNSLFRICGNVYDIHAVCYAEIVKSVNSQEIFIARYFEDSEDSPSRNPNGDLLRSVSRNIEMETKKNLEGERFAEVLGEIICILSKVKLEPWGDAKEQNLTLCHAVSLGIDAAIAAKSRESYKGRSGSLNRNAQQTGYNVCLLPEAFAVWKGMGDVGLRMLTGKTLNSQMRILCCVPMRLAGNLCVGANLADSSIDAQGHLRVGLCLFSGEHLLKFKNETQLGCFRQTEGSLFEATYAPRHDLFYGPLVRSVVRQAIAERCHVLVFPEMVMSLSLQRIAGEAMREFNSDRSLKAVVAGSGFDEGDNVSLLFDANGREVGKQYKSVPYVNASHLTEMLCNPGKSAVFFDVMGFGRIGVAICKDATEMERYVAPLARELQPQLMLVPAFSASLDRAFASSAKRLAESCIAATAVCNFCGARKKRLGETTSDIALICLPSYKEEGGRRVSAPVVEKVYRGQGHCGYECERGGLCLRVADLSLAGNWHGTPSPACIQVGGPIICGVTDEGAVPSVAISSASRTFPFDGADKPFDLRL